MTRPLTVALYVSGHGFGHAVREAEVAARLLERNVRVLRRTEAPPWLFPPGVEPLGSSPAPLLDVGVAQRDSLDIDLDRTLQRCEAFYSHFDERADEEAALLLEARVDAVLGDVPPLAFVAAHRAGVPSAAIANFGWDWIYEGWEDCRFDPYVRQIRAAYARADLLLRLPLSPDGDEAFPAFQRVEEVPLITRRATASRDEVRRGLGIPLDARVVLLSFGGFDAAELDLQALGQWPSYLFVVTPLGQTTTAPPNVLVLSRAQLDYVSLLSACDAVVTKPGYGIVADSLVSRVPVLYTDRGSFREYPILVEALDRLGHARYVRQEDVRAGWLGPHLDALLGTPGSWGEVHGDGAVVIAERAIEIGAGTSARRRASPALG